MLAFSDVDVLRGGTVLPGSTMAYISPLSPACAILHARADEMEPTPQSPSATTEVTCSQASRVRCSSAS